MAPPPGVRGGLRLDAHKERSTAQPLTVAAPAEIFILPLDQHAGAPAKPCVQAGDRVLLGQPIAEPSGTISAWLHSPASGVVAAIEPRPAPHHAGAPSLSIVIENDGREERHVPRTPTPGFEQLSPEELREHIALGGVVGLGGAVFPTETKLTACAADGEARVLLNGAECEPYISCDDMLMRERAQDVVLGGVVLLHAVEAKSCIIAIEDDVPQAAEALRKALAERRDERIQLVVVPRVYPAGGQRQLIATVFGVEVPFDGLPTDIGILCQNVGTAAAIAQWVRDGRPLINRVVTVTGDGVHHPANLDARLGTPIANLIAECGGYTQRATRLIMGGSMMGKALPHDELPVIKATNCVIAASALDLQPRSGEMPCIRCGACSEVCPAILLPQQLHWYVQARDLAALDTHGLMDCIECGCCDYVCPSQIPLAERFRETKPVLLRERMHHGRTSAARAAFEARAARLARREAEQRAALAKKREALRDKKPT
jgi:Na+-translocating ferredoxin:NAD+ oxidoreductase subunit C